MIKEKDNIVAMIKVMFNVRNMGGKVVMNLRGCGSGFIQMLILQDESCGRTFEPKVEEVLFPG